MPRLLQLKIALAAVSLTVAGVATGAAQMVAVNAWR